MGWRCQWCPKSCVPPPWQGEGGQRVTSPCFHRLRRALGQGWGLEQPPNLHPLEPRRGCPKALSCSGTGVPKGSGCSPCPPSNASPSCCTPKPWGRAVTTWGSTTTSATPLGWDRRTAKETPEPRTLTELGYFLLLLFVVVSTEIQSREIYILYIYFLNYTINVQKPGCIAETGGRLGLF